MLDSVHYIISFIVIISVIVFIHEYGHYYFARRFGIKVEKFSIGFGPEIFGKTDSHGTRWSLSVFPLGGYVKMLGDENPSSAPDVDNIKKLSPEEREKSLHCKPIYQRSLVVSGGPLANFIFAILLLTGFFFVYGKNYTEPLVHTVSQDTPAYFAGVQPGDRITHVNGDSITSFEEIKRFLALSNGKTIELKIQRDNSDLLISVLPENIDTADTFGNKISVPHLGITATNVKHLDYNIFSSMHLACTETIRISMDTLTVLGQMLTGNRGTDDLGGPIKIAKYSGQSAKKGLKITLWFMAVLSINLGLINLLPIPTLDGGHLFFYTIEKFLGPDIALKVQNYGMKIGLVLIILLFAFTTFNDLKHLFL